MATVTPKNLFQFMPEASPTLGYTVPNGKSATIRGIMVANSTAAPITVWLWAVPPAGGANTPSVFLPGLDVPANGVLSGNGVLVLEAGWAIHAQGDGLTITGSGAETG